MKGVKDMFRCGGRAKFNVGYVELKVSMEFPDSDVHVGNNRIYTYITQGRVLKHW